MAWGLDDILKLLGRWGEWKRMREAPVRLDELQRQVDELKQKLSGPWPPDVCRMCGEREARLRGSNILEKGLIQEWWDCKACKRRDFRVFKAPTKSV